MSAARHSGTRRLAASLAVLALLVAGGAWAESVPSVVSEKAVFWLDASKLSTLLTNETGGVTNWISRDAGAKVASVKSGYNAPVYEPTKYGTACVDFGSCGSYKDLGYTQFKYRSFVMYVKIQQTVNAWLVGTSGSTYYMHRGEGGQWRNSGSYNLLNKAWLDGSAVGNVYNDKPPADNFYALAGAASGDCYTDSLTRGNGSRNGGRQLCEIIFFEDVLTDAEVQTISDYLVEKWTPTVPGVPAIVARSSFWLDASATETVLTNESGSVTNWVSRDSGHKSAVPRPDTGYLAPTYDATTYEQVCVDFGATGSKKDMTFDGISFQTAFFCVKIEQKLGAWLIGDTGATFMHRGSNGEWKYSTTHNRIADAWQDGEKVSTSLLSTKIPCDDFYILAVRMDGSYTTSCLTKGNSNDRTGGRQLSEVLLFSRALSDEEVGRVNTYLLRKWKLSPSVTVEGLPTNRGTVTPDYGVYLDYVKGQVYTFKAPAALTNDSRTLFCDLNGWTLTKTDFTSESGEENEMSFTYNDETSYATVTWNWADYARLPLERGAWLPQKYRCVEYIEQAGSAYIDTDIKLTTNTTDIVFTIGAKDRTYYVTNAVESTGDQKWLGINGSPGFWIGRMNDKWYTSCNGALGSSSAYKDSLGPLTVVISDGKWTFFDPESSTAYKTESFGDCAHPANNGTASLRLFFIGNSNEADYRHASVGTRIYQLEIYEGTTCAHKLIACVRRKDDQPGFYDLMTGSFYTNAKGSFIAGPTDWRYVRGFQIIVR